MGVGIGNPIFSDFMPIFNIKRQWGTRGESGVSGGEEEAQYQANRQKKSVKKSQISAKSEKKWVNRIFLNLK